MRKILLFALALCALVAYEYVLHGQTTTSASLGRAKVAKETFAWNIKGSTLNWAYWGDFRPDTCFNIVAVCTVVDTVVDSTYLHLKFDYQIWTDLGEPNLPSARQTFTEELLHVHLTEQLSIPGIRSGIFPDSVIKVVFATNPKKGDRFRLECRQPRGHRVYVVPDSALTRYTAPADTIASPGEY